MRKTRFASWQRSMALVLTSSLVGGPAWAATPQEPPKTSPEKESAVLSLNHEKLECVSTQARPEVDAVVKPVAERKQTGKPARVYFKKKGTGEYYYVFMDAKAPGSEQLESQLPRPLPGTAAIDYYIKARDREDAVKVTQGFTPYVTEKTYCEAAPVPPQQPKKEEPKEGLVVGLTVEGQYPVPEGFDKRDIGMIVLVSGAVVTLSAALNAATAGAAGGAAAGGGAGAAGGISTLGIVGIGAGVAAGVAVAASSGGGGSSNTSPSPTPTPTPTSTPTPTPTPTPIPNRPPVFNGALSVSPLYGSVPHTVTATSNATDPDGDPVTVTWSFGPAGATATGQSVTYTYTTATGSPFTVTATATDGRGGSATATAPTQIRVDAAGTPQFLNANVTWSGTGDLDIRLVGPNNTDVATLTGGSRIQAGCGTGSRTESIVFQGNTLPFGTYTLFVRHAQTCGTAAPVTFNFAAQSTAGSKCGGFNTVQSGAEITACTFQFP